MKTGHQEKDGLKKETLVNRKNAQRDEEKVSMRNLSPWLIQSSKCAISDLLILSTDGEQNH